jgi:hypothetical protein
VQIVHYALNSCYFPWPRPLMLIGYSSHSFEKWRPLRKLLCSCRRENKKYWVLFTFLAVRTICAWSTGFIYIYLALPLNADHTDWLRSLIPGRNDMIFDRTTKSSTKSLREQACAVFVSVRRRELTHPSVQYGDWSIPSLDQAWRCRFYSACFVKLCLVVG